MDTVKKLLYITVLLVKKLISQRNNIVILIIG